MKIEIHRGQDQIGGSITKISTKTTNILIDFGEELSSHQEIDPVSILQNCNAVFFTHYHSDHIGLYKSIPSSIPIYIGATAKKIFKQLVARTDKEILSLVERFSEFEPLNTIHIGDMEVTPLLVDHSAFDAYMFLVKANGKKILHTGDFRRHGYRGKALIPMAEKYIGKVNALITEGTTLSRTENDVMTEQQLQRKAADWMRKKKYVFVICSSTNIERIAAFYHANPHGRYFLCDSYQKDVLVAVTQAASEKSSLYDFQKAVVYGKNIEERFWGRGFCMLIRNRDDHKAILDRYPPEDRLVIYSMWKGYLVGNHKNENLIGFLNGIEYKYLHTSGHADAKTIKALIDTVQPNAIIPIHTENAGWFYEKYPQNAVKDSTFELN